jgi:hypothetical protein
MSCLGWGLGLIVIDIVTTNNANFHEALVSNTRKGKVQGELPCGYEGPYATAYRVVDRGNETEIDCWQVALAVGQSLPVLPLWLEDGHCVRVDLNETYERACRVLRVESAMAVPQVRTG